MDASGALDSRITNTLMDEFLFRFVAIRPATPPTPAVTPAPVTPPSSPSTPAPVTPPSSPGGGLPATPQPLPVATESETASGSMTRERLARVRRDVLRVRSLPVPKPAAPLESPRSLVQLATATARAAVRAALGETVAAHEDEGRNEKRFEALSPETREVLRSVGVNAKNFNPTQMLVELDDALVRLVVASRTGSAARLEHGALVQRERFQAPPGTRFGAQLARLSGVAKADASFYFAGVGDLQLVRKRLVGYELGEFAHVENVLAGEARVREHRRLRRREEETLAGVETTTESERDLQSTERTSLERELKEELQQSVKVDAGLTLTGKYGPSVDFTSSLNGGFAQQSTVSSRTSSSYAREVTTKAVERVKERVVDERRSRVLEQSEELNRHEVMNQGPGAEHVRGIYRWLNVVYQAQVFTYGRRAMFDFIVPEPAAFYMHSMAAAADNVAVPAQPDFGPGDITRENYLAKVALFRATGVPEPPAANCVASAVGGAVNAPSVTYFAKSDPVALPDGYEAYGVEANLMVSASSSGWSAWIEVDETTFALAHNRDDGQQNLSLYRDIVRPCAKTISVAFQGFKIRQYSYGVDIHCRPTAEAMQKWQLAVYDRILDAYQRDKADYGERQAALRAQSVQVMRGNPAASERIVRTELQRACISLLSERQLDAYDAFAAAEAATPLVPPWQLDFPRARKLALEVRFFQHAFEWESITFVLYPYFWGRVQRWPWALHDVEDAGDPLFADFLRSGAARVQVPIRPGYEEAVFRFVETGDVPVDGGGDLAEGSLYRPIVDEIREQTDDEAGGIAGDTWTFKVPTSLVLLMGAGAVRFEDPLAQEQQSELVFGALPSSASGGNAASGANG
jgi:hypothetical protein